MDGDNKPTAKFLQARISALSSTLIKRLENIFAAALQTAQEPPSKDDPADSSIPPSLIETATEQFQLDIETTALIRAAEEIMVLTRTMKDLWLFGGLDTVRASEYGTEENEGKLKEDRRVVAEVLTRYLVTANGSGIEDGQRGQTDGHIEIEANV